MANAGHEKRAAEVCEHSGSPAAKRQTLAHAKPTLELLSRAVKATECYERTVRCGRVSGGFWSSKLTRGSVAPLFVPGVLASEPIEAGEVLCEVPASLLVSPPSCRRVMPKLFEAFQALPTAVEERRAEAARATCLALLIRASMARTDGGACKESDEVASAPPLWHRCADRLLGESMSDHPYCRSRSNPNVFQEQLAPSSEFQHVNALQEYVMTVFDCIVKCVDASLLGPGFTPGLFFQAWLSLLTRNFASPHGSAFVPLVDLFNHSPNPGMDVDWDAGKDSIVVTARRTHAVGEELRFAYGALSNPLLYRTYGFTVPPKEEPSWTCTFLETELVEACATCEEAPEDFVSILADLPNLHLDATAVTEELAALLTVCAQVGLDAVSLLRKLCLQKVARYEADASLKPVLEGLRCHQKDVAGSDASWDSHSSRSKEMLSNDVVRVKVSEYLCLEAHLEALDQIAGRDSTAEIAESFSALLPASAGLRDDLQALKAAGLLSCPLEQAVAEPASATPAASTEVASEA
eukprot:TRINITY_DN40167_c0_g1_i1.p1 TRINITY_DN40167_c0_g1~~TRINITY_DN40167_c0_g1_i1.p1  ORF type:complete len:538 (-),score=87.95 TRINITY_DN40167_c0_g1_i1:446-2014(-)